MNEWGKQLVLLASQNVRMDYSDNLINLRDNFTVTFLNVFHHHLKFSSCDCLPLRCSLLTPSGKVSLENTDTTSSTEEKIKLPALNTLGFNSELEVDIHHLLESFHLFI